ncbi:MAG: alpha-L-fucosidase [Verrucomicrobia bacterium]|nr:alpha-L-fucosidase [Verrucomicrobiota bacterium]
MSNKFLLGTLAMLTVFAPAGWALEGDPYANETPQQRDARMAWWREAKFGMFIHWGVYAVPAGTYQDKPIGDIGEWIMWNGKIPVRDYQAFAQQFNPTKYDPAAWVAVAKEAGMRYLVITSKHHDGFALFPSAASKWNIVAATPWAKDLIGPLATAARAQGLKFGLYYSQAQDWNNPGGAKAGMPDGEGWDDAQKGSFDQYLDAVAVPQVTEILTNYKPDVLWWDTPHLMTQPRAQKLAKLLALQPGIIHNNRLGGGYPGDTETPEQQIPATGFPGRDWETCMTMNDTWGFKSYDHNWKPLSTLITNLVDIASKGGNYLLNVGPTAAGEIPAESIKLLQGVGAWMKVNGESIYGTRGTPFAKLPWGRCTVKDAGADSILYLHVLNWPADGKLLVPGLSSNLKSAKLLAGGVPLALEKSENGPVLTLPATAPDAVCSTIKVQVEGKPEVVGLVIVAGKDGIITLLPEDARLSGKGIRTEQSDKGFNVGYWFDPGDTVSWDLRADRAAKYAVRIETAATSAGAVLKIQGAGNLAYSVPQTADYATYQLGKIGDLNLTKDTKITLTLRPVAEGWKPVNVRKVELVPEP